MASPKVFDCPSCGSPLSTSGDEAQIQCKYCGQFVIVPQELRNPPREQAQAPAQAPRPEMIIAEGIAEAMREREAEREAEKEAGLAVRQTAVRSRRRGGGCGCAPLLALLAIALAVVLSEYGWPKTVGRAAGLAGSVGIKVPSELVDAVANVPATPAVVSRPLTAALPRTARYADLDFTVTKANIGNLIPERGSRTPSYSTTRAYATISVIVKNSLADASVYMTDAELHLQLADGSQYNLMSSWLDNFDRQSAKDLDFVFQVPADTTWQGAKLVFGTSKNEQTVLPLDGSAPVAQYPVKLAAPQPATVESVTYKVTSAQLDVDYAGKRVDAGKRYLILSVFVNNQNSAAGGVVISTNSFRVIADDVPLAPIDAPIEAVARNSSLERRVVFVVPADAQRVDLQVGEVGKNTAKTAVALKP